MELKHTKGPWIEGLQPDSIVSQNYISAEDKSMGSLEYYGGHLICESVEQKNRSLISCAPEMLESLIKDVKKELETHNCDNSISVFLKWFIKTPKMDLIEKATGMKIKEVLS